MNCIKTQTKINFRTEISPAGRQDEDHKGYYYYSYYCHY